MAIRKYLSLNGRLRGSYVTRSQKTWFLTDALGSVTATLNNSGNVISTYRYKPYGATLATTGVGGALRFGWAGDTGSRYSARNYAEQYNWHRHYGQIQGQWTSRDILWPEESAFGHIASNPTNSFDSYGLFPSTFSVFGIPLVCFDQNGRLILPPGADYISNCCEAFKHSGDLSWFKDQVKTGGPWEYKQRPSGFIGPWRKPSPYENAGNFHYGFVAACLGIPEWLALIAAGIAKLSDNTSNIEFIKPKPPFQIWSPPGIPPLPGSVVIRPGISPFPWNWYPLYPPYGDDPKDQAFISWGYANAQASMADLERMCRCRDSTFSGQHERFINWRDKYIDDLWREGAQPPQPGIRSSF